MEIIDYSSGYITFHRKVENAVQFFDTLNNKLSLLFIKFLKLEKWFESDAIWIPIYI